MPVMSTVASAGETARRLYGCRRTVATKHRGPSVQQALSVSPNDLGKAA